MSLIELETIFLMSIQSFCRDYCFVINKDWRRKNLCREILRMRSSDMEQLPGVEQALTVINKTHLQTIFCLSAATNRSHLDSDRRGRGGHR